MKSIILRNSNGLTKNKDWSAIDEFEGLIDRFFHSFQPYHGEEGLMHMPIELIERDNNYILKVMIPGMEKNDINIEVGENQVNISGVCKVDYEENTDLIHRSEFCSGNFSRTVSLPEKIDHQKAKADYKNGILILSLPMSKQAEASKTSLKIS